MGSFLRANITDDTFLRGSARILYAAEAQAFPTQLSDLLQLAATSTAEVQTITTTGTPAGGTFRLKYKGAVTAPIVFNASAAQVDTALEALSSIGPGGVVCTGGPLPTGVVVTFPTAQGNVEPITLAVNALTGGTTPTVNIAQTTPGAGQYDPGAGWFELGATKTGIQISRNNTEETYDVDQIFGDIESAPTGWEMAISTALAEVIPDLIQLAWEGGAVTYANDTNDASGSAQAHIPLGLPDKYTRRRMAVLHQRNNGKIRAFVFRKVQKSPQESTLNFQKTGDQQTLPVRFRAFADTSVADPLARFGEIIDQV